MLAQTAGTSKFLNNEDELLANLIFGGQAHYNKWVRPVASDSDSVKVELGLELIEFVELVSGKLMELQNYQLS